MKRTLIDIYGDKIARANKLDINSFVFLYGKDYYYCVFQNGCWSNPIKTIQL